MDNPNRLDFGPDGDLYVTALGSSHILRFGTEPEALFTVSLSTLSTVPLTVDYATANDSAIAGSDYSTTNGTITFSPGVTSKIIRVPTLNDATGEPTETFTVSLSSATGATIADGTGVGTILDDDATKFYVVNDGNPDRTYEYGITGLPTETQNYALGTGNTAPRGAASSAAGDKVWVVDNNKKVYIYDASGALLGSWTAGGLAGNATPEGIATNGTDVWIVDSRSDKVFRYVGTAGLLSGSANTPTSFSLNNGNKNPKDIVTDGAHLWVVNDSNSDKVFKYSLGGTLVGSWTISTPGATSPTGITLDPSNPNHLWIVDAGTKRVYQYDGGMALTSGALSASTSFPLAAGNINPQGIADPLVAAADRVSITNNQSLQPAGDANRDGIFNSTDLMLVFEAGEYEDDVAGNSTFEKGDWNDDGEFNSRDLVFAFQQGNYVSAAVPESLFSQDSRDRRRGEKIVRGDYGPLDSVFAEMELMEPAIVS
jgi:hypothetical protein